MPTLRLPTPGCAIAPLLLLLLAGCGGDHDAHDAHEAHSQGPGPAEHVHVPPHGGVLVELGSHQYALEWVHEPKSDLLGLYVLDAHAENFVRISSPEIPLTLALASPAGGSSNTPVVLRAVGDSRTGETPGNTSHFEAQVIGLQGVGDSGAEVQLPSLEIRGVRFGPVTLRIH